MSNLKLLHIGDAHLGKRQGGYIERSRDYQRVFAAAVDIALKNSVDAVIIPGDLFDNATPPAEEVVFVQSQIDTLAQAGIACVGIDGNHDSADGNWLKACGIHNLEDGAWNIGGKGVISGMHHVPGSQFYAAAANRLMQRPCDVFVIHQTLSEAVGFGGEIEAKVLGELLSNYGVKYLAMGDIHDYWAGVFSGVTMAYPGSLDNTSSADKPNKRVILATVGEQVHLQDVSLPVRMVRHFDILTEEALQGFDLELERHPEALYFIDVAGSIPQGLQRLQSKLKKADVMGRVRIYQTAAERTEEKRARSEVKKWEKNESIKAVDDAVLAIHPEGSIEYSLIMDILKNHDNVEAIIQKHMKG